MENMATFFSRNRFASLLFGLLISSYSFAATYTSTVAGGNWSAASSWTCNNAPCTYPKAGDIVIIRGPVTLNAAAAIGGTLASVTIQTGGNLILSSNLNSNITLSGGTLSSSGINAISLTGAVTVSSTSSTTPLSTAPVSLSGGISITGGTLTYSGGNFSAASLSIAGSTIFNIGTATANSGKLTLRGNANMLGRLVVNKGGTLDASGYTLAVNAGVNGNPVCNLANSNVLVDGIIMVDNLTVEAACMYVSGVASISSATPPGFVKVQKNLTLNQRGDLQIAGLYLVGGNVDADQGNIDITGTGYFGVAGTTEYQNNGGPAASLNYCNNSSILSCSPAVVCPFPNTQNTANECANVCRAYVCSGFFSTFPLPIDLLSFAAIPEPAAKRIRLEWITASETNNDYFSLERSSDGLNFEELNQVKGAGLSASLHTYHAFDNRPLTGINYYRLKQVDLDGKYVYSKMVSVLHEQVKLTLSPNPTDGKKIGILWNREVKEATIRIYNQTGYELYSRQVFNPDTEQVIILPQPLKKGVYLIKIYSGSQIFSEKLIVYN
jgi:archaellum component FlaF (FlaF/FlaG flagellin family)